MSASLGGGLLAPRGRARALWFDYAYRAEPVEAETDSRLPLTLKNADPALRTSPGPIFREIASEVGLNYHHFSGPSTEHYMPEIMGAGVALFDYDNDGDLDVYLVQGLPLASEKQWILPPPAGWKPGNRLFRNLLAETGRLKFEDVTEKAGVGWAGCGMGVAVGDYDNDGFQDLYVTNFGSNVLYHNNGDGTFTDVTRPAGVDDPRWSTSAAWLDYDRDGFLDLVVANYVDFTVAGNKQCFAPTGEPDYCTPIAYHAVPCRLFRNRRDGTFEDVTESSGIGSSYGPGLGVLVADFDNDGWPDIYVANDTAANCLWLNQHNGTFKESALECGVALDANGVPKAGMGVTAEDVEDRGVLDLLVTNLTREGVTFFRNDGRGQFDDATAPFGLLESTIAFTGFGAQFFDYDNDGRLDLFIANGAVTRMGSGRGSLYPFAQENLLFHQEKGRFREVSRAAGPAFSEAGISRGAAFGDIDNDGAMDILVTNNCGPAWLLHNEVGAKAHWLEVRLETRDTNRLGLGAKVAVFRRGEKPLWRRAHTDGSYLSSNDVRVPFGLGDKPEMERVLVVWPDGSAESWPEPRPNQILTLRKGTGKKG
jgi:enediyne biosynthesis protein E4